MNRYLLAGCAAVALTLGCGAANAQTKFNVTLGGDAYFEYGYVSQDNDTNLRTTEMRNRFRLNFVPSAKADNGLEYGGRIRIRASNADRSSDADRALIFVQGGFGRVEAGTRNTWNDDVYVARPQDYQFLGIYDSAVTFAGAGNTGAGNTKLSSLSFGNLPNSGTGATNAQADVHTKIVYVSPRFAGFQLGASYAPRSDSSATSVNRAENDGSFQDLFEIGLNYNGTFSGVSLKGSFGFITGDTQDSGTSRFEDLNGYQAGAQIGYAGFVLGGGYINFGDSGQVTTAGFKDDYEVWNVGLQYTTGPVVLGVGYTSGSDAGSPTTRGERNQDFLSVGMSYTVAPGLRVQGEYAYVNFENKEVAANTATRDVDSNVFLLRSILVF